MHSCRFKRRIYFVEAAPAPSFDGQKSNVATLKGLSFEPFQNCIINVIQIFLKLFRVKDIFFFTCPYFLCPTPHIYNPPPSPSPLLRSCSTYCFPILLLYSHLPTFIL